jgi:hypothetical protein
VSFPVFQHVLQNPCEKQGDYLSVIIVMVDGDDGDEGPTRKFIGGVELDFDHLASLHPTHWCRWRCVSVAPVADVRGGVQCGRHNSKWHDSSAQGRIFGFLLLKNTPTVFILKKWHCISWCALLQGSTPIIKVSMMVDLAI